VKLYFRKILLRGLEYPRRFGQKNQIALAVFRDVAFAAVEAKMLNTCVKVCRP
jgi:hypothetical protein